MNSSKILIIRFSSIGDIVLTTPVVRMLKKQTDAQIHYLTKPQYKSLLEFNPNIDKIIELPKNEGSLRALLKKEKYDIIIDLHSNLRSKRFSFNLSKNVYRFEKLNLKKWLLVKFKYNTLPNVHIVDRYLATCNALNIKDDGQGLAYYHNLAVEGLDDFGLEPLNYVVYAIGGQHQTKKMPLKKMAELLQLTNRKMVLLGGKEDQAIGELLAKNDSIINLCGQTTLHQSALIIEHASKVITHDSGMMHIAAAFRKEIISIWGNTLPEFGMFPYLADRNSVQFEVPNLDCRPCSKIGFNTCPKGHFKCMDLQNAKQISLRIND
jgi:ADP-heptose:LPS heptosyltransferase